MSIFQFLASDYPIKERINPNIELLSLEEAEKRCIELPNWLKNDVNPNRKDKIILFAPSEDCLDDLEIREENNPHQAQIYSHRKYFASLNWRFSENRAKEVILFIAEHLETAKEIEIWHTWLDEYKVPIKVRYRIDELTASILQEAIGLGYEKPICLIVEK